MERSLEFRKRFSLVCRFHEEKACAARICTLAVGTFQKSTLKQMRCSFLGFVGRKVCNLLAFTLRFTGGLIPSKALKMLLSLELICVRKVTLALNSSTTRNKLRFRSEYLPLFFSLPCKWPLAGKCQQVFFAELSWPVLISFNTTGD